MWTLALASAKVRSPRKLDPNPVRHGETRGAGVALTLQQ